MSRAHATLSPSASERWMTCPGSVFMSKGFVDESSPEAVEGTTAHELGERALLEGVSCESLVGEVSQDTGQTFTREMAEWIQGYVDHCSTLAEDGVFSAVETRVSAEEYAKDCWGTSDFTALLPISDGSDTYELDVTDLKYGRGVRVAAEDNTQMLIYAVGSLALLDLAYDIQRVRVRVFQPRIDNFAEHSYPVEEVRRFATERLAPAAARVWKILDEGIVRAEDLNPSEAACRWCPAGASCPKRQAMIAAGVGIGPSVSAADMFDDLDAPDTIVNPAKRWSISERMSIVAQVEDWCKAVRADCERILLSGAPVEGWKLVRGRAGPRKWVDSSAAEEMLRKRFRLPVEQAYDLSVISPTTAEKRAKEGVIGPRQWVQLQPLIGRSEGSLSVAPESDPRPAEVPAIVTAAAAFEDLDAAPANI